MNFERGKNPTEALEIGLYQRRRFDNIEELKIFILQNFVKIMKEDRIPDPYPISYQWRLLKDYIQKYIQMDPDDGRWEPLDEACYFQIENFYRDMHEVRGTKHLFEYHADFKRFQTA